MDVPALLNAKLDRAGELLTELHRDIATYHESKPYTFVHEGLTEPDRIRITVASVSEPPLRLGVMMGEFIHNLRSALDHLVWQLALLRVDEPSTELQFPIYQSAPKTWSSVAERRLRDLPDEAVELIESVQPYHAGTPRETALAVVQALSNEDKHRLLLETISVPLEPTLSEFDVEANGDVAEDLELDVAWGKPLAVGAHVMTIHYQRLGPNPVLHLNAELGAEVGFGSVGFRAGLMPGLVGEIVRLVRRFDDFFE